MFQFNFNQNDVVGGEVGDASKKVSYQWVFDPIENEWHQWIFNSLGDTDTWYIQSITVDHSLPNIYVKRITVDNVTVQGAYRLESYEEGAINLETISSEVRFMPTDFGAQQLKHIIYVDVLGDFADNSVTLTYGTQTDMTAISSPIPVTNLPNGPRRVRNLTRARNVHFGVQVTGYKPWKLSGIDVAYNLGAV